MNVISLNNELFFHIHTSTIETNMTENMRTDNDITDGPISKAIIKLAFPVVLGMLLEFALSTTDYYWVGKLGATAQDAVTSSMVVIWTIFVLMTIVSIGVTALVSRFVGAKDTDKAAYYIKQGLALALFLGVFFSLIGYWITPQLLIFMDSSTDTLGLAIPYLRIFFISGVIFFWNETIFASFRASGDTKTPTIVSSIAVLFNMVLDPLFIFGYGPFPELGVAGASTATAVSVLIGMILITALLLKGKLGYPVNHLLKIKPKLKELWKIGKIGLPMSTQQLVFVIVYWFLIKIVHSFGETSAAAMGIGNRMESFSYLTCFGFSLAASTLVGQNLGAGKPERAAKCAYGSIGIAVSLTLVMTFLFIVFPKYIAGIFTDDAEVLAIAVDYLVILGISQFAMAIEIVLEGSFSGAGNTIPPMVVMIPGSLARIPLAYYLCFNLGWGINGVWWTLTITTLVKSMILFYWFRLGHWKLKEV